MSKTKDSKTDKPKVNPDLEGLEITIDSFGEIKTSFEIDKINRFLDQHVDDKKLRDREDLPSNRKKRSPKDEKN